MTDQSPSTELSPIQLRTQPKPVWVISMARPDLHQKIPFEWVKLFLTLDPACDLINSHFRCVDVSRLQHVVLNGVDVWPVNREIYATHFFEKAWEYGGWPKVTLVFDSDQLERSFKEVPVNIDAEVLAEIKKTYPTMVRTEVEGSFWLSRLAEDDPHIAKPYEREYCRWISGDPFAALKALVIFTDDSALCVDLLLPLLNANPHWNVPVSGC